MSNLKLVSNDPYQSRLDAMFGFSTNVYQSEWCGERTVTVTFRMDAKEWKKLSSKGALGQLYNCDLSNWLSRSGQLGFYAVPSVDDRSRASKGVKTITVRFTERK